MAPLDWSGAMTLSRTTSSIMTVVYASVIFMSVANKPFRLSY